MVACETVCTLAHHEDGASLSSIVCTQHVFPPPRMICMLLAQLDCSLWLFTQNSTMPCVTFVMGVICVTLAKNTYVLHFASLCHWYVYTWYLPDRFSISGVFDEVASSVPFWVSHCWISDCCLSNLAISQFGMLPLDLVDWHRQVKQCSP